MLTPVRSAQFKRDVRRAQRRAKDLAKLGSTLTASIRQATLTTRYRDHPLRGNWGGHREIHIEPDWLLIYRVEGDELRLMRTGSHSELFEE